MTVAGEWDLELVAAWSPASGIGERGTFLATGRRTLEPSGGTRVLIKAVFRWRIFGSR